ncbi:MAG: type III-B CRISPR module-associated Cmr3 family protein [Exilibacterium sp.]
MSFQMRYIEPLDVLNFRGNKSFGEAGEHGESQMPPKPSIFAGALRSQWLTTAGIDLDAYRKGKAKLPPHLLEQLGTPAQPGSFRLQSLWLARRNEQNIEVLMPLPADVVAMGNRVQCLRPMQLPEGLTTSGHTVKHAVMRSGVEKPKSGLWLTQSGIQAHIRGERVSDRHLLETKDLWLVDERLGIALNPGTGTVAEGRLYTTESICMRENTGFAVVVGGAGDMPERGNLRLGGDGRGAHMQKREITLPEPDWERIEKDKCFRVLLSTPGLFSQGWQLPGTRADNQVVIGDGTAMLACAAVPRFDVMSGWDLANWRPKNAQRVVPAGSVYWLENFTGSVASLREMTTRGIGLDTLDCQRRAEGFNNIMIANWID